MNYKVVKQHVKKDEAKSYYTVLTRKFGSILTWLIMKFFPSVSANFITLSMLPLNMLAVGALYYSIVSSKISFLFLSFLISFFTSALDSVDGNIARIKKNATIKGVYFDRLVHNISHPLFFFVIGFAIYASSDNTVYLIIFIVVAILSELSPLDASQKDVETLFIRQAVLNTTKNYSFNTHQFRKEFFPSSVNQHKAPKIIKTVLTNDSYYLMILLDVLLFENKFYFTCFFAFVYILGRVYVRSNIKLWENNLSEVLERLYSQKH